MSSFLHGSGQDYLEGMASHYDPNINSHSAIDLYVESRLWMVDGHSARSGWVRVASDKWAILYQRSCQSVFESAADKTRSIPQWRYS